MQREVAGPSRQRVGDMAEESEVGRPGQDEPAWPPCLIHALLERQEQLRAALYLIEDGGVRQQRLGIRASRRQRGEVVERAVGTASGEGRLALKQRALAGLPQPGQHHDRQLPQGPLQPWRDFS